MCYTGLSSGATGHSIGAIRRRADHHQPPHFKRIFIMTQVDHNRMANAIRGLAMDAVEKAKSGHPGLPMGAADVATVRFPQFLKFASPQPTRPHPDPFLLP